MRSLILLCLLIPALAFAQASVTDHGDGSLTFSVTLPSNQSYVEVFARQNGIQNLATAIQNSESDNGDGTSSYSYTALGYTDGDFVEFRFYHYLPASPGLFTPGPGADVWESLTVGETPVIQTEDGNYLLGDNGDGTFISVYSHSDLSTTSPQQSGWQLYRAEPEDLNVAIESGYSDATFIGLYVKPCESDVWVNIQNTPYAYNPSYVSESLSSGIYSYDIYWTYSPAPGTQPSSVYACGGYYQTINTYIGPQQVRTDAEVTFAYVIEYSN